MDREHAAREVVCVVRSSVGSVFPRSSPAHATHTRSHIAEMPLSVNVQFVTIQVRCRALPEAWACCSHCAAQATKMPSMIGRG